MLRPWGRKVFGTFNKEKGVPCATARGQGGVRDERKDAFGL